MAAFLLAAVLAVPASAERLAARCPDKSVPVRTPDPRRPWACVLQDVRWRSGIDCPQGSEPLTTSDAYDPFKCALTGIRLSPPKGPCPAGSRSIPSSEPDKEYECEKTEFGKIGGGLMCPRGTRPVPTDNPKQPFRCEAEKPAPKAAPQPKDGLCPEGTEKRVSEDPFDPVRCVPKGEAAPRVPRPKDYRTYRIPGVLSFEYPQDWHLSDGWKDEVPTLLIQLPLPLEGRQVTLSLARHTRGAPGFVDMKTAVRREKEWRRAKELGACLPRPRRSLCLETPGESRTAFLREEGGYMILSYSAPMDLFKRYLPVHQRLLDTLRIEKPED